MTKKSQSPAPKYRPFMDKRALRQHQINRILRIMTFSVIFLAGFVIYQHIQEYKDQIYTDGKVVKIYRTEMKDTRSGKQNEVYPTIRFTTEDKRIVMFDSPDSIMCNSDCTEQEIGVYYRADQPQQAKIANFSTQYGEIVMWSVLAIIILSAYLLHLWRIRKLQKASNLPPQS